MHGLSKKTLYKINGILIFLILLNAIWAIINNYIISYEFISFDSSIQNFASFVILTYLCFSSFNERFMSILISFLYILSNFFVIIYISFCSFIDALPSLSNYYWPLSFLETITMIQILFSGIVILYSLAQILKGHHYKSIVL